MDIKEQQVIDIRKMVRQVWAKRKLFYKVWALTFILSCVWVLPQPRYYTCEVKLAPEMGGDNAGGGLSSIASSFGFNIGGMTGQDAIYPELYPDLFESPEFIVGLYNTQVTTKDGDLTTDYYTYMKEHQKVNWLTAPFVRAQKWVKDLFESEEDMLDAAEEKGINPFMMSRKDFMLMNAIMDNFRCSVDTKNSVVSIRVTDQDPLICATMADSVKEHLQDFIIRYRTSKVAEDLQHYQLLRDSAEHEYDIAMDAYSRYCDAHKGIVLQNYQSERDKLENVMALKQASLTAMETQLQSAKVKLQEKTPAFTTLKSSIVPVKPAGPKRMLFVASMLFLATVVTVMVVLREDLKKLVVLIGNK